MNFFSQLLQDAAPKAEKLTNVTNSVVNKLADNKAVHAAKNLGYKGLVNTVGVAAVLATPLVVKAKEMGTAVMSKVTELAADTKASK